MQSCLRYTTLLIHSASHSTNTYQALTKLQAWGNLVLLFAAEVRTQPQNIELYLRERTVLYGYSQVHRRETVAARGGSFINGW